MNFAERIRERAARRDDVDVDDNRFLAVLRALAAGLTAEGRAVARLEQGAHPQRHHLVLYPRHRPSQRHLMLTAWIEDDQVTMSTQSATPPFTDPAVLETWLEEFVARPSFQDSLAELARVAEQPVEAYLRTAGSGILSREDVMVDVSAADQIRLDETVEGADVDLTVRAVAFPGAGRLDAQRRYVALDSAGIAMNVTAQRAVDGALAVTCRKLAPRE